MEAAVAGATCVRAHLYYVSIDVTEYIKYLKLAVAVAIIRSRPDGMTGRQYAEQLCARHQQTQLDWKHEARRLKHQLDVVLQQKSVIGLLLWLFVCSFFVQDFTIGPAKSTPTLELMC